jgi:cell division protein FtsQ
MLNRIAKISLWTTLFIFMIVSFYFVSEKMSKLNYSGVEVKITDSNESGFVNSRDIERIIEKAYPKFKESLLNDVDKHVLEDVIDKNPFVKKSEIYYSLWGKLIVEIKQRTPVVRILRGKGFYLDQDGKKMPLSSKFTSRVLVVSGVVNEQLIKGQLFELVKFITNDEFWKSQIAQIYVKSNKEYILIPRVGNHKIEFGRIDNYQKKFRNLYALYTKGFSKTGWNKYDRINLKYENQVVCTKKN